MEGSNLTDFSQIENSIIQVKKRDCLISNQCNPKIKSIFLILFLFIIPFTISNVYADSGAKSQSTNITIQSLNATELVEALEEKNSNHSDDGILISSSTIIGFFGFGSFLTVRLSGDKFETHGQLIILIYIFIAAMITLHLFVLINVIVWHPFNVVFYVIAIAVTITTIIIIASALIKIVYDNIEEERKRRFVHLLKPRADEIQKGVTINTTETKSVSETKRCAI